MRRAEALLFLGTLLGMTHCASTREETTGDSTSAATAAQKFLVADGVGSESEGRSYYASLGENVVPGKYTIDLPSCNESGL